MNSTIQPYGTLPDGREIRLFTLRNTAGMQAGILDYGGTLVSLTAPGRDGSMADVVLGHAGPEQYIKNDGYLGALVGRNSNRIAGATFRIGGRQVDLEKNNGGSNLHGGSAGLSFRLFDAELKGSEAGEALVLRSVITAGSDGFPGNLSVTVTYTLTADSLVIDYNAMSDADTIINLTNHAYFNLAGHDSGTIDRQLLQLSAPCYTPAGSDGIPTGEVLSVKGTPFDFTAAKPLGQDINSTHPQIAQFGGFDHNFVLSGVGYRRIGRASDPASGRIMTVYTDLPGVQLYTSNMLDTAPAYKDGARYALHQGFCLETQTFPDAVNIPWFPSPVYRAGDYYRTTTTYQFTVDK